MVNFRSSLLFLLTAGLLFACQSSTSDEDAKETNTQETTDESASIENDASSAEEDETPQAQTVAERIAEIKALYAKIQSSANQTNACTHKSKTVINYDIIEEGFPMTNKAKSCQLEEDLSYEQVELNGYEWGETTSFYYHEGKRFFVFTNGGAEGCGYEYRVYYNPDGEIIRMLMSQNECDGREVSAPFEVTKEDQKEEIIRSITYAEKELKELLSTKSDEK